jgi:hypothetical protein
MSITFTCPKCGHSYTVESAMAGRLGRCKVCRTVMQLPTAEKPGAAPPEFDRRAPAEPAPRPIAPDRSTEAVAPERAGAPPRRTSGTGAGHSGRNKLFDTALGFLFFGIVAFVLPQFGIVLAKRGTAMDPGAQTACGACTVVIGTLMLGVWFITRGTSEGLEKATLYIGWGLLILAWGLAGIYGGLLRSRVPPARVGGRPTAISGISWPRGSNGGAHGSFRPRQRAMGRLSARAASGWREPARPAARASRREAREFLRPRTAALGRGSERWLPARSI